MTESETYLNKKQPSIEDWIEYNEPFFEEMRNGVDIPDKSSMAILTDFDEHAQRAGAETAAYFESLQQRVGDLGRAALILVHTDMDDAWHVTVADTPRQQ